jgi:hypothetical protein
VRDSGHLILTVDYELFGNGSGSLEHCVTAPMERMAAVAERHGARMEIFVEALEFDAIERSGREPRGIAAVKHQLAELVARGHLLQLHLHPQWEGARWQDGAWQLDERQWRTGDIDPARLDSMLSAALDWLRQASGSKDRAAHGTVFRAGGWCIQPAQQPLKVLRDMQVTMDSSVAPGLRNRDPVSWFDFRRSPSESWWPVEHDVCCAGHGEFLEVPIAVGRVNALRHLRGRAQRAREGAFCAGCQGSYRSRGSALSRYADLLQKVWDSGRAMLDICALPAELLAEITRDWLQRPGGGAVPVVAIGHTKNFSAAAEREFDRYLAWASAQPTMQMSDYRRWQRALQSSAVTQ